MLDFTIFMRCMFIQLLIRRQARYRQTCPFARHEGTWGGEVYLTLSFLT